MDFPGNLILLSGRSGRAVEDLLRGGPAGSAGCLGEPFRFLRGLVGDAEGNVDRWGAHGQIEVAQLVVEEDVGAQRLQDGGLWQPAEEEGIVHLQAPGAETVDGTLMGGRRPGGHQRDTQPRFVAGPSRR